MASQSQQSPKITVTVKTLVGELLELELIQRIATAGVVERQIYEMLPDIPFGCARLFRNGDAHPLSSRTILEEGETLNLFVFPDNVRVEVFEDAPSVLYNDNENDSSHRVGRYLITYHDIQAGDVIVSLPLIHDHTRYDTPWALRETFDYHYRHSPQGWNRVETLFLTERTAWYSSPIDCLLSSVDRIPTDPHLMAQIEDAVNAI